MVEAEGVRYLNATEAARYLGLERSTFYSNVRNSVSRHKPFGRRRWMYLLSELETLKKVESVEPVAS